MEVYVQVTIQVVILLLARSETATTESLETVFNQKVFGLDPDILLIFSISWSLLSCVRMHTSLVTLEKGISKLTTKVFIFLWGAFATLRRILSIIVMFMPSLGLFSILHHWRWEQIPFKIRQEYIKKGFTISSDDRISLFGQNETIYWTEFEHWDYSHPQHPSPPHYSIYTLLSLQTTFIAAAALLAIHFLLVIAVKILTSREFRKRGNYVNKTIHVLENLNYATPFYDWDQGEHTIQEYGERFKATCREMMATFSVNTIVTAVMLVPLWYTGQDIKTIFMYLHTL